MFQSQDNNTNMEEKMSDSPPTNVLFNARGSIMMGDAEKKNYNAFVKNDSGDKGYLTRMELQTTIEELTYQEFDLSHIEVLYTEFDNDGNGKIDFPEFKTMISYLGDHQKDEHAAPYADINSFASLARSFALGNSFESAGDFDDSFDNSRVLQKVVRKARRDSTMLLKSMASNIYPFRDILCVQDTAFVDEAARKANRSNNGGHGFDLHTSTAIDFDVLLEEEHGKSYASAVAFEEKSEVIDKDFHSAFPASDMRCLALVSHNGMKKTMREFVVANKNILKKFRLTGTNSTMTMLKEVFKDEPAGTIVFGPACASGPLGGDAELVALMVGGKIGGIFFFQDPMDSHPHRADIDCLVRQALVHNVMLAETPVSALMMLQCLRIALKDEGRPELIPSFFFSLQSPTVEAYKARQKKVVEEQKDLVK